jgi:hypothetical protein
LDWELINKWASIITIVGFIITVISLIITLTIKSQVAKIRASYTFDKRINTHIKRLKEITTILNTYFDDYDKSRNLIKTQLGICQSELENIVIKLDKSQRAKITKLISFIKNHKKRSFSIKGAGSNTILKKLISFRLASLNETSDDDIWFIYISIHEIITQIENIKKDKDTILN